MVQLNIAEGEEMFLLQIVKFLAKISSILQEFSHLTWNKVGTDFTLDDISNECGRSAKACTSMGYTVQFSYDQIWCIQHL